MPTPYGRHDGRNALGERERQALRVFDAIGRKGPDAVREETLRMKSELVRLYGWEGYQLVLAKMESDLARLRESRCSSSRPPFPPRP